MSVVESSPSRIRSPRGYPKRAKVREKLCICQAQRKYQVSSAVCKVQYRVTNPQLQICGCAPETIYVIQANAPALHRLGESGCHTPQSIGERVGAFEVIGGCLAKHVSGCLRWVKQTSKRKFGGASSEILVGVTWWRLQMGAVNMRTTRSRNPLKLEVYA